MPKWDVYSAIIIPLPMREFLQCSLCWTSRFLVFDHHKKERSNFGMIQTWYLQTLSSVGPTKNRIKIQTYLPQTSTDFFIYGSHSDHMQNSVSHRIMRPSLMQCSRLRPSYEFHFERLSKFSPSVDGLVHIQDVNPRILI